MDYLIEFWNEDGQGSKKDLTDNITGDILYPYSIGLTQKYYFNSDVEGTQSEIIEEEVNSRGQTRTIFTKIDKFYEYSLICSEYQCDVLHTLNNHSHKYMTDENGNKTRIERVNIEINDEYAGSKRITLMLLPDNGRIVIAGNF